MFGEEQVKQYRSITAPAEMRDRVLNSAKKQKKNIPARVYEFAGFAACLAVIIAVSLVLGSFGGTTVEINGQVLTAEPAVLPVTASAVSARTMSGITLDADLEKSSTITVSEGQFYVFDSKTGQRLERHTFNKEVTIIWDILPTDTEAAYTLTIENSRGVTEVSLLFNEAAGWQICCIEK